MEHKIINVSDIKKKRSSLKNPEDIKRVSEVKQRKSVAFLDPILENDKYEQELLQSNITISENTSHSSHSLKEVEDFQKHRRESLKNEYSNVKNLLSKSNKFIEVETELITRLIRPKNEIDQSDLDVFLFETTKAWWLAKGKTITISNIKEFLTKI